MYDKKVVVPDVLPNNLRTVREMQGKSLREVAETLLIDKNFLGAVEMGEKNFSGKTAIRTMKLLEVSFYQLYDFEEEQTLSVTMPGTTETIEMKFDLNFSEREDFALADFLIEKGYQERVVTWQVEVDEENNYINDNVLYLDGEYKIPKNDSLNEYDLIDKFNLDDERLMFLYSSDEEAPKTVRFKAIRPALNNLTEIRERLGLSVEEMSEVLTMSTGAYQQLEQGSQKASLKTMWRLVYFFKLPLELIINIDEYYERFCKYDTKIIKRRL